ncbi:MAG: glycosyltransferase family 39 protein [Chloroflexota bacterium]
MRRFQLSLLAAVLVGLLVRWLVLRGANWRIDYDEAMVGLQVTRLLHGEFAIFLPGQPYLGSLESYLLVPFFALFGANNPTLKLVPLLLSGVYVATTGLIARVSFGERIGTLSAFIAALAPTYLIVVGLKAWGATSETLVLGNLLLLVTLTILHSSSHSHRDWALLGLIVGCAFWISWLIAFYTVPVVLVLVWRFRRKILHYGWIGTLFFFLGSSPFWIYNIQYPLATFKFLLGGERGSTLLNSPRILKNFIVDLAPRLVSGDPAWHVLSRPMMWPLVIVYGVGLLQLVFIRQRRDSWLLAVFVICFLPLYIFSGFGINALNPFGIDATGRYVLMLHSVLPIGLALLVRIRRIAGAMVAAVLMLNLVGVARIDPTPAFASPYYIDQPATLHPLIDLLDSRGITHIWTDVGIAHVLMFETHERILAADYYDRVYAHGLLRFPEIFEAVTKADRVAYVELIQPGQTDTPIDRAFTAAQIDYERLTPTPRLLVIIPRTAINPEQVLAGLGFQYNQAP